MLSTLLQCYIVIVIQITESESIHLVKKWINSTKLSWVKDSVEKQGIEKLRT